jgi:hypothetical protein
MKTLRKVSLMGTVGKGMQLGQKKRKRAWRSGNGVAFRRIPLGKLLRISIHTFWN